MDVRLVAPVALAVQALELVEYELEPVSQSVELVEMLAQAQLSLLLAERHALALVECVKAVPLAP